MQTVLVSNPTLTISISLGCFVGPFIDIAGVMAVLVDRNPEIWPAGAKNDGQIINIVGGVSLMIAQFVVTFWYGEYRRHKQMRDRRGTGSTMS